MGAFGVQFVGVVRQIVVFARIDNLVVIEIVAKDKVVGIDIVHQEGFLVVRQAILVHIGVLRAVAVLIKSGEDAKTNGLVGLRAQVVLGFGRGPRHDVEGECGIQRIPVFPGVGPLVAVVVVFD